MLCRYLLFTCFCDQVLHQSETIGALRQYILAAGVILGGAIMLSQQKDCYHKYQTMTFSLLVATLLIVLFHLLFLFPSEVIWFPISGGDLRRCIITGIGCEKGTCKCLLRYRSCLYSLPLFFLGFILKYFGVFTVLACYFLLTLVSPSQFLEASIRKLTLITHLGIDFCFSIKILYQCNLKYIMLGMNSQCQTYCQLAEAATEAAHS